MDDAAIVARQLGRSPRALRRVVVRCPFGRPAVTEQSPYDSAGRPFPTTYYLTCPQLVARVSRLEAAGGVERWSRQAQQDDRLRASLTRATEQQRTIRRQLATHADTSSDGGASLELGIGASANPGQLKCLHAHVAYALAQPEYGLGGAILEELRPLWPADACCTAVDEAPH